MEHIKNIIRLIEKFHPGDEKEIRNIQLLNDTSNYREYFISYKMDESDDLFTASIIQPKELFPIVERIEISLQQKYGDVIVIQQMFPKVPIGEGLPLWLQIQQGNKLFWEECWVEGEEVDEDDRKTLQN